MSQIYLCVGESVGTHGEGWNNCLAFASQNLSQPQLGTNQDGSNIRYMVKVTTASDSMFRGRKGQEDPVDLDVPKVPGVDLVVRANDLPLSAFINAMVTQLDINYKLYFWRVQHPKNTKELNIQHNWMTWTGTRGKIVACTQSPGADGVANTSDDMVFLTLKATRYLWEDHDRSAMGQISHENLASANVKHPHAAKPPSARPGVGGGL